MNYEEFLELYQGEDSELAREAYTNMISQFRQENFGSGGKINISNLGLGSRASNLDLGPRALPGDVNPFYSSSDPIATGGYVPHVTEHYTVAPPNRPDNTWDIRPGLTRPSVNTVTGDEGRWTIGSGASHGGPGSHEGAVQMYNDSVASAPYSRPHVTQDSFNIPSTYQGPPEGLLGPTGAIGPQDSFAVSADPSLYGGSESALASAATDSATDSATGLSGPQMFAANMALNMIPTRDRNKINTPFGDEGSFSGIFKGAGKGALTGLTLSGGNPYGALAGGVLGAFGGTQGLFDSTTPPSVQIARIKRGGGGMQKGLLGGIYA